MKARRGFTLIELLVVIAVIAILAAILFPLFAEAKHRATQTKCLAHLKQLTQALRQYIDDNNGLVPPLSLYEFPNSTNWSGTLQVFGKTDVRQGGLWRYVKNYAMFICPSDIGREAKGLDKGLMPSVFDRKNYPLSYSINGELNKRIYSGGPYECLKLDTVRRPSLVLFLIHESRDTINDGLYLWKNNNCDMPDKIHFDGTNCTYCDGHAKWIDNRYILACHKTSPTNPSPWDPEPWR